MSLTKAIIPAAGLGKRLLPATQAVAKELFPVLNKPLIQLVVEEAADSGIEQVIIVVSEEKQAIRDYFKLDSLNRGPRAGETALNELRSLINRVDIRFVQQDHQLGLGHALLMAREMIDDEFFAVLLGDNLTRAATPVTRQLLDAHRRGGTTVIGAQSVAAELVNRYGIMETVISGHRLQPVKSLVEKPAVGSTSSCLAIAGRYILPAAVFRILEQQPASRGGEIQLTDALQQLVAEGEPVCAYEYDGERLDLGCGPDFIRANILAALDRPDIRQATLDMLEQLHKQTDAT